MGQGLSNEEIEAKIAKERRKQEKVNDEVMAQAKAAEQNAWREKARAIEAERRANQENEKAQKAEMEAAQAREQVEKANREAALERKKATEALREAHTQRERLFSLESENEETKRKERKQAEAKRDQDRVNDAVVARAKAAERDASRERARVIEKELKANQANEKAQKALKEAAQAREQAEKANRETALERKNVTDALREAHTQRERFYSLESEIEETKRKEQKQREKFKWGPKKNHSWTEEESQVLVKNFKETTSVKNQPSRGHTFLLFGPTSHGKSSFANGCLAALENLTSPPMRHHVAQGEESVTRKFSIQKYGPHKIIDMPGIFESEAITTDSIKMIVTGQIDWVSKVTNNLEIEDLKTANDNTVECIIIIMRYDCDLPPQMKRQIGALMEVCGDKDVSCHLVLTHLDICDPQFKDSENLPKIYESYKVLKAVEGMWEQTGIPANNISFIKNYTTETETDLNSKLQYLRILNTVKENANSVVAAREDKANYELFEMKKQLTWGLKDTLWSEQEYERLKDTFVGKAHGEQVSEDGLESQKPDAEKGLTFLLFGPTGHGKSSFGNGCWAALKNTKKTTTYHEVRQSQRSVSSAFGVQQHGPHKIIDMPGIYETEDIESMDIKKIVTGQIRWDSEITPTLETKDEKPATGDTVECIIIILKYDCDLPPELERQIQVILDLSGKGELSYHLVLTHLDVCDPQFKYPENLPNIYNSVKVLKAVKRMSRETGIPASKISFVKNYTDELETDLNSKLQSLRILDLAKEYATTLLEKKKTKANITMEYKNKTKLFPEGFSFHEFMFCLCVILVAVLIVYLS